MADITSQDGPMLAADGTPLKKSLARALRNQKMRALMLIAPLLVFVLISFIVPIFNMLTRSVDNDIVANTLPETVPLLAAWDASAGELPDEEIYAAFARDMIKAVAEKNHTKLGTRLNYGGQVGSDQCDRQVRGMRRRRNVLPPHHTTVPHYPRKRP